MKSPQGHICRLSGNHLPGVDCLSDDQVVPLLIAMDPDTLVNCGQASKRLFDLVCDRVVWRHLLKKTTEFSKEKLEELAVFGKKGSTEMMLEVVKEAARRIPFCQNLCVPPSKDIQEEERERFMQEFLMTYRTRVKITVAVQAGWGTGETFEVDGKRLQELTKVAQAVGAKFTMEEVEIIISIEERKATLKMIADQMDQQGGRLAKFGTSVVVLADVSAEDAGLLFDLLKLSNSWRINLLILCGNIPNDYWTNLASVSTANGHIDQISILNYDHQAVNLGAVRKAWEISNDMKIINLGSPAVTQNIRGGRTGNLDLEAEWQHVVDILQ